MKRIFTLCIALCTITAGFAQTDTTIVKSDTIRIGGMVIIRKPGKKDDNKEYRIRDRKSSKHSNLRTNWWILDLGFSNYSDNTVYTSPAAQAYAPGSNNSWFELRDGKSRNVNIWFFMQRLNVIKNVVNLKYGLGLELNNYHFQQEIIYQKNTLAIPNPPRVTMNSTTDLNFKKNKLALDYLTVPMMINFNLTPNRKNGFGISGGISAGYLYSARQKTISNKEGKEKTKDDFEIEKWKLAYIAELALGPVRFYGSYAMKNMYERGLDFKPYTFGFRFSNW